MATIPRKLPTQKGTKTQVHQAQRQFRCSECEAAYWRTPRSTPSRYCSLACRRKAVASRQRGIPRVERTDPQRCTRCDRHWPLADYPIGKSGLPLRRCTECAQPSPETKRRSHLRQKFGMTLEQWIALYEYQRGRCAICQDNLPPLSEINTVTKRTSKWSARNWNTDHCHKSGKVRGILCRACNQALGSLRDNPTTARRAAEYLERHSP